MCTAGWKTTPTDLVTLIAAMHEACLGSALNMFYFPETANTKQVRAAKREEVIRNQSTNIEMVQEKK